jgi:predicted nucleotidyltransferase
MRWKTEMPNKDIIISTLKSMKPEYEREGLKLLGLFGSAARDEMKQTSDIDILMETSSLFVSHNGGGFGAIARLEQIKEELSKKLGAKVDLTDRTGLGAAGEEFILKRAIYV